MPSKTEIAMLGGACAAATAFSGAFVTPPSQLQTSTRETTQKMNLRASSGYAESSNTSGRAAMAGVGAVAGLAAAGVADKRDAKSRASMKAVGVRITEFGRIGRQVARTAMKDPETELKLIDASDSVHQSSPDRGKMAQITSHPAEMMPAFGLKEGTKPGSLDLIEAFDMPVPELRPHDVLIRVTSSGMNPVDTKKRKLNIFGPGTGPLVEPLIMGYDVAGVVEKVGSEASLFKVGEKVYAAGQIERNGSNAELVAVDERIVGHAPESLSATVASAQALILLTAWEGLFEGLGLTAFDPSLQGKRLLILPAAGGVGCYVVQMASKLLGLEVIACASAKDKERMMELGAKHVISSREPLKGQLEALGIDGVDFVYNAFDTAVYFSQYAEVIKPYGKIVSIVETDEKIPLTELMVKRVTFTWELMFTRPMMGVEVERQGKILNDCAKLIDAGMLKVGPVKALPWSLESLKEMHSLTETGNAGGKLAMTKEPIA
eukprot:TRINITY_DN963_c0_g1_i6.p1 TRINITY_DN963_c0_g1~~TRINITY_DN963_c0_g1_i6.p1  ORF type:complete len:491 (-),score=128.66 TRINITY_DN963_c0_g1_i6:140-1612(-)